MNNHVVLRMGSRTVETTACRLPLVRVLLALVMLQTSAVGHAERQRDSLIDERRFATLHPGHFARNGATLHVGPHKFVDKGRCANDEGDCIYYRADAIRGDFVGISISGYESSGYIFAAADGLEAIAVGGRPMPSPSGRRFFVVSDDPTSQWHPLHGAAVWQWTPAGPERLRVVDRALAAAERFVAWRGENCVEFTASRSKRPEQRMWLAEFAGDWQVSDTPPAQCKG